MLCIISYHLIVTNTDFFCGMIDIKRGILPLLPSSEFPRAGKALNPVFLTPHLPCSPLYLLSDLNGLKLNLIKSISGNGFPGSWNFSLYSFLWQSQIAISERLFSLWHRYDTDLYTILIYIQSIELSGTFIIICLKYSASRSCIHRYLCAICMFQELPNDILMPPAQQQMEGFVLFFISP